MTASVILQSWQDQKYFSEDLPEDIFDREEREVSPCVLKLHEGLDCLGINILGKKFPQFLSCLERPWIKQH